MGGRRCFVPGCKSGYDSNKQNVSTFRVPADKVSTWKKLIARKDLELTVKSFVCEKHFRKEFIVREVSTSCYTYPLAHPRLTEDAVPTIFPKRSKSKKVKSQEKGKLNEIETVYIENDIKEEDSIGRLFNELWAAPKSVTLPSESWGIHCVTSGNGKRIHISEMMETDEGNCVLIKKLTLSENSVKVYIFEHVIDENVVLENEEVTTLDELQTVLGRLNEVRVCYEGLNISATSNGA